MAEKIAGNPITSAKWASEAFSSLDEWSRIREVVLECLVDGAHVIEDSPGVIRWVIETLEAKFELKALSPFTQARFTVRIFEGFEDRDDAVFFTNALNQKSAGGNFVHDSESNSICFVTYCGLNVWWDLALMLYSARAACGHAEAIAHRSDLLSYNNCRPALSSSVPAEKGSNNLVAQGLWDMTQPDFISGLWVSDAERQAFMKELTGVAATFDVTPICGEDSPGRNIEKMDFRFRAFPDEELSQVFDDNSASCFVMFNEWTEWGRALSIHVGLPFFTQREMVEEGSNEETAVSLANLLNHAAVETLFQKLGFGAWFAKGTQLCFSAVIPHAILKPIILGVDRRTVAELLFDFIDPQLMNRVMNGAGRLLLDMDLTSEREPNESDSVGLIIESRKRPEAVRGNISASEISQTGDLRSSPSMPFLIYGIFNPIGPTMGSLELVSGIQESYIVNRWRHPHHPGEEVLFNADTNVGTLANMQKGVNALAYLISLPDFIWIPQGLPSDLKEGLFDALMSMAQTFEQNGTEIASKASRMWKYPNPWLRPLDEDSKDLEISSDFEGWSNPQAYVAVSTNPGLVDLNIGLFQAWWEGAIVYQAAPDGLGPQRATETVEIFMQHTYDRMVTVGTPE
jgi:hypothetical protein